MTTMSRARVVMIATSLAVAIAACGLPNDSAPRPLANDAIPFDLLASNTTVPPATGAGPVTVTLFFLNAQNVLQEVARQVDNSTPTAVMTALLSGPLPEDGEVRSAIPPGTRLVDARRDDNILIIVLSGEILTQQGPDLKVSVAQLVLTATRIQNVGGVRFKVEGDDKFLFVPTDTGSSDQPVYPIDYASVRPQS